MAIVVTSGADISKITGVSVMTVVMRGVAALAGEAETKVSGAFGHFHLRHTNLSNGTGNIVTRYSIDERYHWTAHEQ